MKRWGLLTISNLWWVITVSGMMTTTALSKTAVLSTGRSDGVESEALLLTQTDAVLELGSEGNAVKELQAMLSLLGYYPGAVDGFFGDATFTAVSQFQVDAGLVADGVVGPVTWQRLLPTPTSLSQASSQPIAPVGAAENSQTSNQGEVAVNSGTNSGSAGDLPVLRLDDVGDDVSMLQRRLEELSLYTGPVDGVFGPQTEQSVQKFQNQAGLDADGVVGPATWTELLQ